MVKALWRNREKKEGEKGTFKFVFVYLNVILCTRWNSLQSCNLRNGKSLRRLMCLNNFVVLTWYLEKKDMYFYYMFCLPSGLGKGLGTIFCNLCLLVSLHIAQSYCSCIHNMYFIVIPWQTTDRLREKCTFFGTASLPFFLLDLVFFSPLWKSVMMSRRQGTGIIIYIF